MIVITGPESQSSRGPHQDMTTTDADVEILIRLLLGSGIVVREEVDAARAMSEDLGLSVIDSIKQTGMLTEAGLAVALELQSRIASRSLTFDIAIRAMRLALQKQVSIDEAIDNVKRLHQQTKIVVSATNELTNILLTAGFMTSEDLGRMLKMSQESSIMVGQLLAIDNVISTDELLAALNAVSMVREDIIEKGHATQALRYSRQKSIPFEQALFHLGFLASPPRSVLRQGELFAMAGSISREDLAECMEIEMFKKKDFGQVLLERAMANSYQLQSAAQLITLVASGKLRPFQAVEVLKRICKDNTEMEKALNTVLSEQISDMSGVRLADLIVHSGVVSSHEMSMASAGITGNDISVLNQLEISGAIDQVFCVSALRLYSLLSLGYLQTSSVIDLMKFCHQNNNTLDQALSLLDIYVPSAAQWSRADQWNWVRH